MAVQSMQTKGLSHLGLLWWMRAATSSLPVPVSPVMRRLLSVAATLPMYARISCITGLSPTIHGPPPRPDPVVGRVELAVGAEGVEDCRERQLARQRRTLRTTSTHEKGG